MKYQIGEDEMNKKMKLLAVMVAAMLVLSACGAPASVTSSDAAQETQPPASTPVPQSPSNEEKQAGNINDNFSYEYYFTPYDSTNETNLDKRCYTIVATNNNDIEVKGDFKVFLAPKGETPDTSALTTKSSSNFVLRPGDKVMISGFCYDDSLDYDFEEITVVPNMEPRSEEEIKEEPLSIMDDITFDYTIENKIIKGKLTNHNDTYTTSKIWLEIAEFNGDEYVSYDFIWYFAAEVKDANLALAPGESVEFTMDRTDGPAFDNLKYTINAYGWLNDYE